MASCEVLWGNVRIGLLKLILPCSCSEGELRSKRTVEEVLCGLLNDLLHVKYSRRLLLGSKYLGGSSLGKLLLRGIVRAHSQRIAN